MITLGQASNYSFGRIFRHLFAWGTEKDSQKLREALAEKYHTQPQSVALYHTGRSALAVAIQSVAGSEKAAVIIPGLTCIAVVRAVKAAGCDPYFVDIQSENLSYNLENLEKAIKTIAKNNKVCYNRTIILVQNTLGITWHVSDIEKLAQKYDVSIVEDLAHSAGRIYPDGREVGTVGQAVALSFGKGKAIDTISGGAVILRDCDKTAQFSAESKTSNHENSKTTHNSKTVQSTAGPSAPATHETTRNKPTQPTIKPKFSDRLRDRWYPLFGGISRLFWRVKLGRIFMCGLVKIHWVQRSADAELNTNCRLTHWQAKLALRQLTNLPQTPLREYKLVNNRKQLLQELSKNGYYFDEIWYDTPVSPQRYEQEANFPAESCPETVKISQQIINFPTWYPAKRLTKAHEIVKKYEVKS